jgi:hypothetical protein
MEAVRKKERQVETEEAITIDGFLSFTPSWMLMYFFAGFIRISPCSWPNSGFWCCLSFPYFTDISWLIAWRITYSKGCSGRFSWSFFHHVTRPSIHLSRHPSMDGIIQGRKPWQKKVTPPPLSFGWTWYLPSVSFGVYSHSYQLVLGTIKVLFTFSKIWPITIKCS